MSSSQPPRLSWAAMAIDVTANFDGPSPVYSFTPVEGGVRGARFSHIEELSGAIVLVWRLLSPLPRARRNPTVTFEIPATVRDTGLAPFVPVTAAMQAALVPAGSDDETFCQVAIVSDAPPEQGSPPITCRYFADLGVVTEGP